MIQASQPWGVSIAALSAAVVALLGAANADEIPTAVLSDHKPAVSALNAKLEGEAGTDHGHGVRGGGGSVTIPLGFRYGAQADVFATSVGGRMVGAGGGHVFWRDPDRALLGLYASYSFYDLNGGKQAVRIGPEAEVYLNRISLSGVLGAQAVDARRPFFTVADFSYYPIDNLKLSVGYRYSDAGHGGAAGAEMQVYSGAHLAVSLFGEGRLNRQDQAAAWAGVRLYFGADKSLIRRHREDDPPSYLPDDLHSIIAGHPAAVPTVTPPPSVGHHE